MSAVGLLAFATSAEAQQARASCRIAESPFDLTLANQIKGGQLRAFLSGKRLVAQRLDNDGASTRYGFEFRPDGSLVFTCHNVNRQPCFNFTPGGAARDIGVWRVEGDVLVLQRTRFAAQGRADGRVTFHRQGGIYVGGRTNAPHFCLAGPLLVE